MSQEMVNISANQQFNSLVFTRVIHCSTVEPELKPGDLKKNYEPDINRGNIAYETFCKHIERLLQNGVLKVGRRIK